MNFRCKRAICVMLAVLFCLFVANINECNLQARGQSQTFILVAGAWHNSWYWQPVKQLLEAKGHKVIAVDLPGHGNSNASLSDQSMEKYAQCVADIIEQQQESVILVGHSMSGAVASQAAEYEAGKVKRLVILCGFLPKDGESINGLNDGIKPTDWIKAAEAGLISLSKDQAISYVSPRMAREKFYNDMSNERIEAAINHLNGELIAAQQQPVHLGKRFADIPKIYIKTLNDKAFPPELQDQMIERGVGKVYTINSGHSPFLSASEQLTSVLLDIADARKSL